MKQKKMVALLTLVACFQIHSNSLNADEGGKTVAAHNGSHESQWSDNSSGSMSHAHTKLDVKGHNDDTDAYNFSVWGMFTYWNMTAPDALVSVIERSTVSNAMLLPKNYTRPGFKVGLGMTLPPAMVDVDVEFTWFENSSDKNKLNTTSITGGTYESGYTTAGGALANTFYRADFTLDKELMFGDNLTLVPGGGVIGVWGESFFNRTLSGAAALGTESIANKEEFWGIGPYADLGVEFHTKCCMIEHAKWVLFMKSGTGFTWTDEKATFVSSSTAGTIGGNNPDLTATAEGVFVQQMIDASLGLRWEMGGDADNTYGTWAINLAWDYQWWPNLLISNDQVTASDMALQGLTTGLAVKF